VYTPPGPPPEGSEGAKPGAGEFTWHELATTDAEAALDFYTELFGWEKGPGHEMGGMGTYQIIEHHGAQVGGAYNAQGAATPPHWLSYVQVPDCSKATDVAKEEGARVLNGPMEVPGGSWITMLEDPQGGSFAVVEAPKAAAMKPAAKAKKPKAAAKADAPAAVSQPESKAAPAAKKAARKTAKKGKSAVAKKAPAKKVPAKKTAAKKSAAKKTVAKKAAKKVAKKSAGKAVKSTSAKRGKSAPKKKSGTTGKRAGAKKGKRR
jgi:predicted enzyme related to lactoylglutathione lyase